MEELAQKGTKPPHKPELSTSPRQSRGLQQGVLWAQLLHEAGTRQGLCLELRKTGTIKPCTVIQGDNDRVETLEQCGHQVNSSETAMLKVPG